MSALRGAEGTTLLVLFHDSRDLCTLEADSGAVSLVASTSSTAGVIWETRLNDRLWKIADSREHVSQGYVYTFREPPASLPEDLDPSSDLFALLFYDSDKDGVIDSSDGLTLDEWDQAGLPQQQQLGRAKVEVYGAARGRWEGSSSVAGSSRSATRTLTMRYGVVVQRL